jgi:two-component system nitrogen regulation sensor histidine kinase NtrY
MILIAKLILINIIFIAGFLILLPNYPWLFTLTSLLGITLALMQLQREKRQQDKLLNMLKDGLLNLQDGDFSISLSEEARQTNTLTNQVVHLFNQVIEKLREEKKGLYQRELLLDKVVNASDVVTVLINQRDTIIFANRAAQHFCKLNTLLGQSWSEVLEQQVPDLMQHGDKNNAIIQLMEPDNSAHIATKAVGMEQSWHLSRHQLTLHGSSHQLILLKPITRELHKQELQTWKKVIRVVNHELNNTIAPISSMCHSGRILAERLAEPQLNRVFRTISSRVTRLSEFIQNYSELAKLSVPQKQPFNIVNSVEQLQNLYPFTLNSTAQEIILNADESQVEQLLINLLKNAKEVSSQDSTQVCLLASNTQLEITVRDFGPGMSQEVMQKAFLPNYSTKAEGSGVGLSICREVMDAHDGHIILNNHPDGGLQVLLRFPLL